MKRWFFVIPPIIIISISLILIYILPKTNNSIYPQDYHFEYLPVSEEILNKGITYIFETERLHPPGMALLLTIPLFFSQQLGINTYAPSRIFTILTYAISCIPLYFLIKRLTSEKIALISMMLWSFYPLGYWFAIYPFSELPYILFLYISLLLAIYSWKEEKPTIALIGGIVLFLSALIKMTSIFLAPIITTVLIIIQKRHIKRIYSALAFSIGFFSILGIFILANYLTIGKATLGVSPISPAGLIIEGFSYPQHASNHTTVPSAYENFIIEITSVKPDNPTSAYIIVFSALKRHPELIPYILPRILIRSWYATFSMEHEKLILFLQLPIIISAAIGLFLIYKNKTLLIFSLTIISYFWFISTFTHALVRYILPVMPILFILSSQTLLVLWNKLTEKSKSNQ